MTCPGRAAWSAAWSCAAPLTRRTSPLAAGAGAGPTPAEPGAGPTPAEPGAGAGATPAEPGAGAGATPAEPGAGAGATRVEPGAGATVTERGAGAGVVERGAAALGATVALSSESGADRESSSVSGSGDGVATGAGAADPVEREGIAGFVPGDVAVRKRTRYVVLSPDSVTTRTLIRCGPGLVARRRSKGARVSRPWYRPSRTQETATVPGESSRRRASVGTVAPSRAVLVLDARSPRGVGVVELPCPNSRPRPRARTAVAPAAARGMERRDMVVLLDGARKKFTCSSAR